MDPKSRLKMFPDGELTTFFGKGMGKRPALREGIVLGRAAASFRITSASSDSQSADRVRTVAAPSNEVTNCRRKAANINAELVTLVCEQPAEA
jgi:hypothetical protein